MSILFRVFSSSRSTIALFDLFMYVSVDGTYRIRAILIAVISSASWMYLDIYERQESGVCVRWYDMVVRREVDRIEIHAMIILDPEVLTGNGEI